MAKKAATNKQAAKKARQMAAARAAKGAAEYNGVESRPFDIKLLMKQVATAQVAKSKAQTKLGIATKKELVADVAQAKEELAVAKEELKDVEKATAQTARTTKKLKERRKIKVPDVDSEDAVEKVRIFGVVVYTKMRAKHLTADSIAEVRKYQERAKDAVLSLPPGSTARLSLFSQYADLARKAAKLKAEPTETPAGAPAEKAEEKKPVSDAQETRDKLLGKKKIRTWKALDQALILLGKGKDAGSSLMSKGRQAVTSLAPVSSAYSTFAVQGIAKIGPGLRYIGRSIKENGTNTLKWIGNKLSALTRGVMGMFRSARNMLTSNSPGDWAAMAAIGIGILPQIVQGMLDELKKRFGEDFVIGFIKEKWESTKTAVTQWLGEFIDKALDLIKSLPEKIAKGASYLWDKTKQGASAVWDTGAGAVKSLFAGESKDEVTKKPITKPGGSAMDKLGGLLADHSQAGITPGQKMEVEKKIRELVLASPSLYNDSQVIANLQKRGIKIDAKLSQTTNNTSTATATPSAVSTSTNITGGAPGAPVTGGGGNTVTASPPESAGSGSGPVTAQQPTPQAAPADGGGDSGGSTPKTGGMSNATVPDNAAPDTLFFMNLASMGAA